MQCYYYIFNGRVQKAPNLQSLIATRLQRAAFQLNSVLGTLDDLLGPTMGVDITAERAARAAMASTTAAGLSGGQRLLTRSSLVPVWYVPFFRHPDPPAGLVRLGYRLQDGARGATPAAAAEAVATGQGRDGRGRAP